MFFFYFEFLNIYFCIFLNPPGEGRPSGWCSLSQSGEGRQAGLEALSILIVTSELACLALPTSPQLSTGLPGPLLPDISLCWLDTNILEIINRTEKSRITGREAVRDYLRSSQESFIRDCKTALTVSNQHCNPSSPPHHLQCNKKYWSSGAI